MGGGIGRSSAEILYVFSMVDDAQGFRSLLIEKAKLTKFGEYNGNRLVEIFLVVALHAVRKGRGNLARIVGLMELSMSLRAE